MIRRLVFVAGLLLSLPPLWNNTRDAEYWREQYTQMQNENDALREDYGKCHQLMVETVPLLQACAQDCKGK